MIKTTETKKSWITPGVTRYGAVEDLTLNGGKCKRLGPGDDYGNGLSTAC